jgi:hypothetical protein
MIMINYTTVVVSYLLNLSLLFDMIMAYMAYMDMLILISKKLGI